MVWVLRPHLLPVHPMRVAGAAVLAGAVAAIAVGYAWQRHREGAYNAPLADARNSVEAQIDALRNEVSALRQQSGTATKIALLAAAAQPGAAAEEHEPIDKAPSANGASTGASRPRPTEEAMRSALDRVLGNEAIDPTWSEKTEGKVRDVIGAVTPQAQVVDESAPRVYAGSSCSIRGAMINRSSRGSSR